MTSTSLGVVANRESENSRGWRYAFGRVARSYAVEKILRLIGVLFVLSVATAAMVNLVPGNPAYQIVGEGASPQAVAAVDRALGLQRPFFDRYWTWLTALLHGNLGRSYFTGQAVVSGIHSGLPVTAELIFAALSLALVVAIPVAIFAAWRSGGWFDRLVLKLSSVLVSCPTFIMAPLLVYFVSVRMNLLPAIGWVRLTANPGENLRDLVLPAVALSLTPMPIFIASLRSDMITTLQEDFILNARAEGMSPRAMLFRQALKPSSLTLVTLAALSLGGLIGGAVIVELIFGLPGLGTLLVNAVLQKDLPTVQGLVMFIGAIYVVINGLTDVAYRYLDPRIQARAG